MAAPQQGVLFMNLIHEKTGKTNLFRLTLRDSVNLKGLRMCR